MLAAARRAGGARTAAGDPCREGHRPQEGPRVAKKAAGAEKVAAASEVRAGEDVAPGRAPTRRSRRAHASPPRRGRPPRRGLDLAQDPKRRPRSAWRFRLPSRDGPGASLPEQARTMKSLSGVDAAFLHLETPETPMHVGSVSLFDLPARYRHDFHAEVKRQLARRLHLAPVLHRKLAPMPLQFANPVWVEDDAVDLDHHVQRVTLPPPGTMTQFDDCVGRLHAELLDRSRPLWRLHVIDGLESGQVGYYFKAHHAALDGQAGIVLARTLFDLRRARRRCRGRRTRMAAEHPGPGRARRRGAAPRRRPVRQARAPPARRGAHSRGPARPREGGRRAGPAAAELRLRPADAAECADHRRARLRRPVAAARRTEGACRRARRQAQRHRAGAVQRRAAPLPGAPRRHPEEAADGGDADLAARGRQHRLHDAGDDAARQPAHARRRPGAAPGARSATPPTP